MPNNTASSGQRNSGTRAIEDWDRSVVPMGLPPELFKSTISDGAFRMYAVLDALDPLGNGVDRKRLAAQLHVSPRTVFTRALELEEAGLLKIAREFDSGGGSLPVQYALRDGGQA